jgi:hypothetical protein
LRQPGAPRRSGAELHFADSESRHFSDTGSDAPSPFYPGFVVAILRAARYLFLGVDQPSYHAHSVMATLGYRF